MHVCCVPWSRPTKTMHARDNVLNNEASATHNSTPKSGELGRPNPISNLRLKRMHVCCVPWRTKKRAMHAHDNVLNSEANATHNSSTKKRWRVGAGRSLFPTWGWSKSWCKCTTHPNMLMTMSWACLSTRQHDSWQCPEVEAEHQSEMYCTTTDRCLWVFLYIYIDIDIYTPK